MTGSSPPFIDVADRSASGEGTLVLAINEAGEAAGNYFDPNGYQIGFTYNSGVYTTILDPSAASWSKVTGLNDSGTLVGFYYDAGSVPHGFIDQNGAYATLDDPNADPGIGTEATAINDAGEVVGFYGDTVFANGYFGETFHGFTYQNGVYTTIDDPNADAAHGGTVVYGVDKEDQVAGLYYDSAGQTHGFIESGGAYTTIDDPLSVYGTKVTAIAAGVVAGNYTNAAGIPQGFIYYNGAFTTISDSAGVQGTTVIGINNQDTVYGYYLDNSFVPHGFTYSFGTYTIINDPQSTSGTEVTAVNNTGTETAGYYNTSGGSYDGFIIPCYCSGAAILTEGGEVAVETLTVGDLVVTARGERRPIQWIGHRTLDIAKHPFPAEVWPVRVSAGAFGENLPRRDLWISPRHAVFFNNVLIPIIHLANGSTIAQQRVQHVSYWHVELESHDLLLAEGLAAESFLDCGTRAGFANHRGFVELHPSFAPKTWSDACAPLLEGGAELADARRALVARAESMGFRRASDPELHILVDGEIIWPRRRDDGAYAFVLPNDARPSRLMSRTWRPADGDEGAGGDQRHLGVAVHSLEVDGCLLDLDSPNRFGEGWGDCEGGRPNFWRWTNGAATLPPSRQIALKISGDAARYWAAPEESEPPQTLVSRA